MTSSLASDPKRVQFLPRFIFSLCYSSSSTTYPLFSHVVKHKHTSRVTSTLPSGQYTMAKVTIAVGKRALRESSETVKERTAQKTNIGLRKEQKNWHCSQVERDRYAKSSFSLPGKICNDGYSSLS